MVNNKLVRVDEETLDLIETTTDELMKQLIDENITYGDVIKLAMKKYREEQ